MKLSFVNAKAAGTDGCPRGRRSKFLLAALAVLTTSVVAAELIPLASCPESVQATIRSHLHLGTLDDVKKIEVEGRVLYLVDIDVPGLKDLKLYINGSGKLQKSVEEIRFQELPEAVRGAVEKTLAGRGHVEEVERVIMDGRTEYHVEIERPKTKDVVIVFDGSGSILDQK